MDGECSGVSSLGWPGLAPAGFSPRGWRPREISVFGVLILGDAKSNVFIGSLPGVRAPSAIHYRAVDHANQSATAASNVDSERRANLSRRGSFKKGSSAPARSTITACTNVATPT